MADPVPAWLATMRELDGTKWAPGDGQNPTILEWLRVISSDYPSMASYCASVMSDEYFSWCGLTAGLCMAKAGIAPVFGASDTSRFLFAAAWMGWGTPVTAPQPGDVVVFDFGGGDHHVTFFEKDNGNGTWSCHGGNQSHAVMLTNFPKSKMMGVRRPTTKPVISQDPVAIIVAPPPSQRFAACVALVLKDEGGNDDDPRDPGGRTSRGITQNDWNAWLQKHPGLPSDVFQAPQDQIIAIYHSKYWNALSCDGLPAGVDYAVFDYGVLSGIGRSAKVLQGFLGVAVDGEIGPQTTAAAVQANASTLIKQICDERLAFLQGLSTFPTFGKGWTARVQRVLTASLAMASSTPPQQKPQDITIGQQIPMPGGATQMTPEEIALLIIKIIGAVSAQQGGLGQVGLGNAGAGNLVPGNILQILGSLFGAQQPGAAGQQPVQNQDILQSIVANLVKQQGAGGQLAAPIAAPNQDIGQLILGTLLGKQLAIPQPAGQTPANGSTTMPPVLTPIDKLLGGDALAGKKTLIAVAGFVIQLVLQFSGVPGIGLGTTAGNIIMTLLGGFGGLGMVSKVDRVVQLLGTIAGSRLPALPIK
jgi:uncharacterized protein (TIGR02594 family)